jgi:hypothetical protein
MSETLLPEPDVPWQGHPALQGVNLPYSPCLDRFQKLAGKLKTLAGSSA